ncbi:MAG: hypothetical protein WDW36_001578 [Sanguina aurantia]
MSFAGLGSLPEEPQQQHQQHQWLFPSTNTPTPFTATSTTEPWTGHYIQLQPSPPQQDVIYAQQPYHARHRNPPINPHAESHPTVDWRQTTLQANSNPSPAADTWPVLPSQQPAPVHQNAPSRPVVAAAAAAAVGGTSKSKSTRVRPQQTLAGMKAELARKQQEFNDLTTERSHLRQKLRVLEVIVPMRAVNLTFLSSMSALTVSATGPATPPELAPVPPRQQPPLPTCGTQGHMHPTAEALPSGSGGSNADEPATAGHNTHVTASSSGRGNDHNNTASASGRGSPNTLGKSTPDDEFVAILHHTRQAMLQQQDKPVLAAADRPAAPACLPACTSAGGSCMDVYESTQALQVCTPLMYQRLWKDFLRETAMFVIAAECHGLDEVCQEVLETRISQAMALLDKAMLLYPDAYFQSMYVNMESKQQDRPRPEFWTAVAKRCRFSKQQAEDIIVVLKLLSATIAPVVIERASITEALAVQLNATAVAPRPQAGPQQPTAAQSHAQTYLHTAPTAHPTSHHPHSSQSVLLPQTTTLAGAVTSSLLASSSSAVARALTAAAAAAAAAVAGQVPHAEEWGHVYTSLHALSAALKRNIMREHSAHMTLSNYLSFNVLTKMQLARVAACSYPHMPDVLAIVLCDEGQALVDAGVPAAVVAAVIKDM